MELINFFYFLLLFSLSTCERAEVELHFFAISAQTLKARTKLGAVELFLHEGSISKLRYQLEPKLNWKKLNYGSLRREIASSSFADPGKLCTRSRDFHSRRAFPRFSFRLRGAIFAAVGQKSEFR